MESTSRARTFVVLDFWRFTTAFAVLLFHYEQWARGEAAYTHGWFVGFANGVDFFFVLSGFVIAHNYAGRIKSWRDYAGFLQKRLARIYPLHILTLLIVIGLYCGAIILGIKIKHQAPYDFSYLPAQLLLTHAWGFHDKMTWNTVSWSISAEWLCYLVFPALTAMIFSKSKLLGFLYLIVFVGLLDITLGHRWLITTNLGAWRALPSFAFGILLWRVWSENTSVLFRWPIAIAAYAVCLVSMLLTVPQEIMIAICGTAILASAFAERSKPLTGTIAAFCEHLGNMSYALYMLHAIVGQIVFAAISPKIEFLHTHPGASALLAASASIILSALSYRYFEHPARLYFMSLGNRDLRINVERG
jgi:peptidoglycan/LPS O-acetylase OafA/YrhL